MDWARHPQTELSYHSARRAGGCYPKLPNEPEEFKRFFKGFEDAKVAMETAYFWQPVYELIEQLGREAVLAHPKETRIIAKRKVKTNAKDSEALAPLVQLLMTMYRMLMWGKEFRS